MRLGSNLNKLRYTSGQANLRHHIDKDCVMVRKQYTWRGNEVLLSITLLISFQCFSADDQMFHGESTRILERAYKLAPYTVCHIVDALQGKEQDLYESNYLILNGKSGVGKSTLALAMAYKLQWDVHKCSARDFIRGESSEAAAEFNSVTQGLPVHEGNLVFIIDEINYLLSRRNHDTDSVSISLCALLDEIRHKRNIFFIGTASSVGDFSPQIQDRFDGCVITITAPQDLNIIKENFFEYLKDKKITVSNEVQQYVENNAEILNGYNARDIINLVDILKMQIVELTPDVYKANKFVVEMNHIEAALKEKADLDIRFQQDPYEETEFEQRERHHRETLEQSRWQFNVSTALNGAGIFTNITNIILLMRFVNSPFK